MTLLVKAVITSFPGCRYMPCKNTLNVPYPCAQLAWLSYMDKYDIMEGKQERGYIINFLDELKRTGNDNVKFVDSTGESKQIELTKVPDTDVLFSCLNIKPEFIRYYPLDARPYIEIKAELNQKVYKLYIEKVK